MEFYLVKDLSRLSGISIYTLKYYLKLGLLRETGRSTETNFRYFDNSTLDRLKKIIEFRRNDISLDKIRQLMDEGKNR